MIVNIPVNRPSPPLSGKDKASQPSESSKGKIPFYPGRMVEQHPNS